MIRYTVAALMLTGLILLAPTYSTAQGGYPQVSHLKPFTVEANYMSLPGYLRFKHYEATGEWLDRGQAVAIVQQQIAAGGTAPDAGAFPNSQPAPAPVPDATDMQQPPSDY